MNDIIRKWNDDIRLKESLGESIDPLAYIKNREEKIIDLKYLTEIDKANLTTIVHSILVKYKKESTKRYYGTYQCSYYFRMNINNDVNCDDYKKCMLCKLDYLISINRIKIQEVLINE